MQNLPTKEAPGQNGFIDECCQTFMEEITSIPYKFTKKYEKSGKSSQFIPSG